MFRTLVDILRGIRIKGNWSYKLKKKLNSVVLARKRTIPTERPQPVGEVSANFSYFSIQAAPQLYSRG
jgi:hypothetical protein